jgi:hypothetical protein
MRSSGVTATKHAVTRQRMSWVTRRRDANDRELWRIYVAEDVGRYGAAYDPEQSQVSGF